MAGQVRRSRGGGGQFGKVAQRRHRRRAEISFVELRHALEGVDLFDRLVVADANDARKAKRIAALVAGGGGGGGRSQHPPPPTAFYPGAARGCWVGLW